MSQEFLGVYATNEAAPSLGDFPQPLGKRKRLWFVWETAEGRFKVQALNAVHQPMADARIIAISEFEQRFLPEPACLAMPEEYAKPHGSEEACPSPPLPDLFAQEADTPLQPLSFLYEKKQEAEGRLNADDPDLLRHWAQTKPRIKKRTINPAKIPFDRLVGEMEQEEAPEAQESPQTPPAHCEDPENRRQPEEARLLRSKFVQALLLLRRGEREESIALLQDILNKAYPPFTGAAQLFSEFGLGLRRLGLITLALAAHKRAWEYAPEDERILFNIARSYHDLDLLDDAQHFLKKALAVAPDFASARQFLAFLEAGTHKDA